MNKKQFFIGIILASIFASGITIFAVNYLGLNSNKVYQTVEEKPNYQFSSIQSGNQVDFREAAAKSTPAVVHIMTFQEVTFQNRNQHNPFNDMLKEFFGERYYNEPQPHTDTENNDPKKQPIGAGSGVIISEDGYIVTNNHVVKGADEIHVTLNDKRKYIAKLIGTDPTTDLALLKVEEGSLPYLEFTDSDEIQVGEWVLAVGNPFNLTSTVTAGIVSAKARNINILKDKDNLAIESFIQTDAAVNPGNSGGALVNTRGELVGINSAIASPTGAFAGYSFAIPANLVNKVIEDIRDFGEVQRALLGVSIQDVNADLAKDKNMDKIRGVYVAAVSADGAGKEAGLKEGDVILSINGVKINTTSRLQEEIAEHRPGDKIEIIYLRDGKEKSSSAILKNKLGTTEIVKKDEEAIVSILGSKFQKVTDAKLKALNLRNGVQLIELGEGKIKEAGIEKNFIVVAVDKQPVRSPAEIANVMAMRKENSGVLVEGIYPSGQRAYYGIGW